MNADLEIRVAQIRDRADALGQDVADLVRDAYALGRSDGLADRKDDDLVARRTPPSKD